jgi:aryl-alcohol dehydrogenase-like predicted oxidoreductase
MNYAPLGNTGLYVSRLTMGTMTFALDKAGAMAQMIGATGQELATRMVDLAIEAGINIFDTANMYSNGESEAMLGKALGSRRKDVLIATKVYFPPGTDANALGTSRLAIMREVDASLKRLNTDYIDLYQVHSHDVTTPLEETIRALDDLVRQGKVRYIGLSNFAAWQIAKADGISRLYNKERFCSVQAYYSLVGRELEREIIPSAIDLGLGILVWSPLAGGFLSGKFTRGSEAEGRRKAFDFPPVDKERGFAIIDVLRQIAQSHNASVAQIALAWLLHQKGVTSVIIGARREEQLSDNLKSASLSLSDEELSRLSTVSMLTPEYPHWMAPLKRGDQPFARFSDKH